MIRDSNPDFRINPVSDPDVCRIGPKMLWIHYLVCISQFAECRENRPMVVWEMLINLKSATLQRWRMWKSERKSVSRTGSPIIGRLMKSADCFCSNPAQRMTVRLNDTAISRIFKMADLRHLEKSPCETSFRSSIETIAVNYLLFEKIAILYTHFGDGQTDRHTDRQTNRWDRINA